MKSPIVLGNWKANKTIEEAKEWIDIFSQKATSLPEDVRLILCPAFHHIHLFLEKPLHCALGVQDLSSFPSGAYTGEISGAMVKGNLTYALLGHSERRIHLGETDELVSKKTTEALKNNILPIVCVSDLSQVHYLAEHVSDFVQKGMVLYEPVFAIGTGKADSAENANAVASDIKKIIDVPVLYGGSITSANVVSFVQQPSLAGVGVGGASLDPNEFFDLVKSASVNL